MLNIGLKHALPILGTLALIATFGYIAVLRGEVKNLKAENSRLDEQLEIAALEINQCDKDKALSERVSNDYQNANTALRRDVNRLRNSPACILPKPSSTSGVHSGTGNQLSGGNGIRVDWLYDIAGRAEQDRITGAACLKFMDELYKSRGYNE